MFLEIHNVALCFLFAFLLHSRGLENLFYKDRSKELSMCGCCCHVASILPGAAQKVWIERRMDLPANSWTLVSKRTACKGAFSFKPLRTEAHKSAFVGTWKSTWLCKRLNGWPTTPLVFVNICLECPQKLESISGWTLQCSCVFGAPSIGQVNKTNDWSPAL